MNDKPLSKALIIGNGRSRLSYSLKNSTLTTFGCNALYRDFVPDYLIAIDDTMIGEIIQAKPKCEFIVPPFEEQFEPAEYNPNRPRENAGMVAMREAIKRGFTVLECIGLDFLIQDYELNMANVYDGTPVYLSPVNRTSFNDVMNRCKYFEWFTRQNPNITFNIRFPGNYLRLNTSKDNVHYLPLETL